MVGAKKYHPEQRTRMALSTFNIINISRDIAERSVALRQEYKLKLPDAIILATAQLPSSGTNYAEYEGFCRYSWRGHAVRNPP